MPVLRAAFLGLAAMFSFATTVNADSDATLQQIYDQASTGHLDRAQQMIDQVLLDHPKSARAHYVAAQLALREGKRGVARNELGQAEQLDPGLRFASPEAVRALKAEIGVTVLGGAALAATPENHSFPWVSGLLLAGLGVIIWMIVRRRSAVGVPYTGAPMGAGPYPVAGTMGAGIGSGIAGGLASGLALGAGVVAGEEIAHHFLDGNHQGTGVASGSDMMPPPDNMGGNDFGVNDAGGGWDDGGGGGGGGDWS